MRNLKLKGLLQYIFFLGLGIVLIWYSARDLTPDQLHQIKTSWQRANLWYVVPVFIALLLSHLSRAMRWRILMLPLGFKPGLVNTYLAVLLGYFFNLLMPRLGEVMKCTLLARHEKVAPDQMIGTILTERIVDMLCLLALTLFMILWQYDLLGSFVIQQFKDAVQSGEGGFSWVRLLVLIVIVVGIILLFRFIFRRFAHIIFIQKIRKIAQGIGAGIASFKRIDNKLAFWGHTTFIWAMYLLGIYLGFKSFEPVSHLGFAPTITALVFGSFGMVLTQGGIGAFQIATQKALSYYNINAVEGLSFGWLMWVAQTALVIVAGVIALIVLPVYNERLKSKQVKDESRADSKQNL